jgi:hypothetical protein
MPKYRVIRTFEESSHRHFVVDAESAEDAEEWVDRFEYDNYEDEEQGDEAERRVTYVGKEWGEEGPGGCLDVQTELISEEEYAEGLKEERHPGDTFADPPISKKEGPDASA